MPALPPFLLSQAFGLVLVLCRIGGMVAVAPALGAWVIPIRLRLLLALAITMVAGPACLRPGATTSPHPVEMVVLAGGEAVIGAALGLGVAMLLSLACVAGQLIGQLSGVSLSEVLHPETGDAASASAQFLYLVALAVYVTLGGPRLLVGAVLHTFRELPPGSAISAAALSDTLLTVLGQSFQLGIRAAMPALAALLLSAITLTVVSRTLPQLNVLSLSLGINALIALAVMAAVTGLTAHLLGDHLEPTVRTVVESIVASYQGGQPQIGLSP
jgi:flagellar biosynthetic protein FliR